MQTPCPSPHSYDPTRIARPHSLGSILRVLETRWLWSVMSRDNNKKRTHRKGNCVEKRLIFPGHRCRRLWCAHRTQQHRATYERFSFVSCFEMCGDCAKNTRTRSMLNKRKKKKKKHEGDSYILGDFLRGEKVDVFFSRV